MSPLGHDLCKRHNQVNKQWYRGTNFTTTQKGKTLNLSDSDSLQIYKQVPVCRSWTTSSLNFGTDRVSFRIQERVWDDRVMNNTP